MKYSFTAAILLGLAMAVPAGAATFNATDKGGIAGRYESNAYISKSPAEAGKRKGNVAAAAFGMHESSGVLGDFAAFCLDLATTLKTHSSYKTTDTPFSNSFALGGGKDRVQAVFDANYATLDLHDRAQGAALQLSLWEVIYDGTDFDLTRGNFRAKGTRSYARTTDSLAKTFLANAKTYTGPKMWNLTFLESTGKPQSQNLVTASAVSAVPLPAGGMLLLTGLGGWAGFSATRRRKAA
ncbi:hypothetical protein OCGS_1389 [Oceaniovalibus guishaninsula JLT2003]|uniref:VPLPA-CTERM protein sorting domain-containing protein n=1 Tax=Oceaniovalibus guishaninsula JLT2003 TaxID=1231392 RepID=K2GPG1_9RHOB|nr:hypothetical protein [Oceaniovalibus guishaninsula]EKE44551.1 hypothetical protein OCGS_1389 [Oceaniovalibus guishaninsula JLT2003]